MAVQREPSGARLLHDLIRLVLWASVLGAVGCVFYFIPTRSPWWLDWSAKVVAALCAQFIVLAFLRVVLPKPPIGAHRVDDRRAYTRWLLASAFADVAMHPLLRLPFWTFHISKVMYLKALGANLPWHVYLHDDLVIRDPSLLSIGAGAQLEPGVTIESAQHGAGRIRIAPVIIGAGCLVGSRALLLPGATLGHEAKIGPGALVGEDVKVGVSASIGERACLEKGVDLGSYAVVGTGAIVSEGVKVGDRGRIASGSVVEPNLVVGERETWTGVPAQPATATSTKGQGWGLERTDKIRRPKRVAGG